LLEVRVVEDYQFGMNHRPRQEFSIALDLVQRQFAPGRQPQDLAASSSRRRCLSAAEMPSPYVPRDGLSAGVMSVQALSFDGGFPLRMFPNTEFGRRRRLW
jgi:hypothetical protein